MSDRLFAPFTGEQVVSLNRYQQHAPMHPFTCPHRDSGHVIRDERDIGILVASEHGWHCLDCDYTQNWAWPWMADTSWWAEE